MAGPADSSVPLDTVYGYPDDFQIIPVRVATQGSVYIPQRAALWVADRDLVIDNAWVRPSGAESSTCNLKLAFASDGNPLSPSTDLVTAAVDLNLIGSTRTEFALDPNYRRISKGDVVEFYCDAPPADIQEILFGFRVRSLTG